MIEPESNRKRLEQAGILDRTKELSQDQNDAIESLSPGEIDQLISINEKLSHQIPESDPMLVLPGINQTDQLD
jgi:hypothetical protein